MQVAGTDSPRELMPSAQRMINALDEGDGVLIITDIFGASPSNLACKMLVPGRVELSPEPRADAGARHHLPGGAWKHCWKRVVSGGLRRCIPYRR